VTSFLRLVDVWVEEKGSALHEAIAGVRGEGKVHDGPKPVAFEQDVATFATLPGTPFAYWVTERVRAVFGQFKRFESEGRAVRHGAATLDDFRFLRVQWETDANNRNWVPFVKGGAFSPFYSDVHLSLDWAADGREVKAFVASKVGSASRTIQATDFYFRPGLTWPRRTQSGFGIRVLPAECIFADKGPSAFVAENSATDLLALLAVMTSTAFCYLIELQVAFGSYEVGVIQRTPVPTMSEDAAASMARLARRAWSLKRALDAASETSHAFLLPLALQSDVFNPSRVQQELDSLQQEINAAAFALYGIGDEDQAAIESSAKGRATADEDSTDSETEDDDDEDESQTGASTDAVTSWLVGVAFGRFDPRLATGERPIPPEPEPFQPLPSRSPGMYPKGEEPADRPDILVNDEGHPDDLAARARAVAERVRVEAPENLRGWLAKDFLPLHIKMYSKSRRKAPIYWQLATRSASYSVWLYIHAFSKDTLFRVQNDYVAPKLAHEERRLESLTSELRDGATAAQRKTLAAQESVVEELRAFLDEVKRVAPLWNPNLDDGVIINFAPLWRLVPQNKSWQKELKSTWDALCEGKYDWAHLAMHLWPERVVPKCAKDRSLAIAHGLEDVFWVEGSDGKCTARKTPPRSVDELMREHSSPAVKSALKSLLEAPAARGKSTGRGRGALRKTSAAAAEGGDA
jgi:hypothetical protein